MKAAAVTSDPLTCAICETPLPEGAGETALFPFCSERCKLVDLGRWFDGDYAVVSRASIEDIENEMERRPDEETPEG